MLFKVYNFKFGFMPTKGILQVRMFMKEEVYAGKREKVYSRINIQKKSTEVR